MAHKNVISQHLQQPGMSFINVGPNQTYTYADAGAGMEFDVHGSPNPQKHEAANALLKITHQGPGFAGQVDLGHNAELWVQGMGSTSYDYDPVGHHLRLWSGNTLIDALNVSATDPITVLGFYGPGVQSATLITTGWAGLQGYDHTLPVHTLTT